MYTITILAAVTTTTTTRARRKSCSRAKVSWTWRARYRLLPQSSTPAKSKTIASPKKTRSRMRKKRRCFRLWCHVASISKLWRSSVSLPVTSMKVPIFEINRTRLAITTLRNIWVTMPSRTELVRLVKLVICAIMKVRRTSICMMYRIATPRPWQSKIRNSSMFRGQQLVLSWLRINNKSLMEHRRVIEQSNSIFQEKTSLTILMNSSRSFILRLPEKEYPKKQ